MTSIDPSASALLNALMARRETWDVQRRDGACVVEIPLREAQASLWVSAHRTTTSGRHALRFPAWLARDGVRVRPLSVEELAEILVAEPLLVGVPTASAAERFVARVAASRERLEQAVAAQPDLGSVLHRRLSYIEAEQSLVCGHAAHPTPKAQDGLSPQDARTYAPEHRASFSLRWLAVAPGRRHLRQAVPGDDPFRALSEVVLPGCFGLLPVHPWQAERLLAHDEVRRSIARGEVQPLEAPERPWWPTSSLRTLWTEGAPMLKFSLSVRLTNSMRTLREDELERSLILSRILRSDAGQRWQRSTRGFTVLDEPAYAGLQREDGALIEESAVLLRDNPFGRHTEATLLALLNQEDPQTGDTRLAASLRRAARRQGLGTDVLALRWLDGLLRVLLEPVLVARVDHGVLMSAHQQNVVLGFGADGVPDRAWFRDAQGTAYTPLARLSFPEALENVPLPSLGTEGDAMFVYSAVLNGALSVIPTLVHADLCEEPPLLARVRACLEGLRRRRPADPSCLDLLLDAPRLWTKGNLRCAVHGHDEVSLPHPFQTLYHPIPNPLLGGRT
jgi:N2-citryl-N6-acetyl-N6-hydroxylysine synthase